MKLWAIVFVVIYWCSPAIRADDDPKTIIVIHAYHLGFNWTYNNNEGLREIILEQYPNANIYTEFLDWKRFPDNDVLLSKADEYKIKYKNLNIDLLLTTDDIGLQFAITHREELFDNAPIAFSGIIPHSSAELIGEHQNITGVYENIRPEGVLELIRLLQPDTTDIVYIHDQSESGLRTAENFNITAEKFDKNNGFIFSNWSGESYQAILDDISLLDKHTIVIISSYNSSSDGVIKSPETFLKEISLTSAVPIYSTSEALLGHGITGGTFLSGVLQGRKLGQLGIRILKGEDPDSIPHVARATVYTGIDELELIRFGLDKDLLADDIYVMNEQFSFFKTYFEVVIITAGIIVGLISFIVILMRSQRSLHISRKSLMRQKVELRALYKKVQISETRLLDQNKDLVSYQTKLEFEAYHDHLTKLPNRLALDQHVTKLLRSVSGTSKKLIIAFIDLDNFKFLNNAYGHHLGDEILVIIAERLSTLEDNLYTARIGGDEFVATIDYDEVDEKKITNSLLLRISHLISQPVVIDKERILVKASIGYSVYPDDGDNYEQLIVEADTAMYQVKKDGRNSVKRYKKSMSNVYKNEYVLTTTIKEAYLNKEFTLVYQPIMLTHGSDIQCFEALARWNSSVHGIVSPDIFIPVAETTGLIMPIGYLIIDQALAFASTLSREGLNSVVVAINISVVQFHDEEFVDILLTKVEASGVDPSSIRIEITESVIAEASHLITEKLSYLREKGIKIALDDFGTGYSSLAYLHRLPIDIIKIDKLFVDEIVNDHKMAPLVDTTITLANNLGLEVIAEGVEELHQLTYLKNLGCQYIQGYYFSKPLLEKDAIEYAKKHSNQN